MLIVQQRALAFEQMLAPISTQSTWYQLGYIIFTSCHALQVRQQFERLPGAPRQFSRLVQLSSVTKELTRKAAELEAKAVPRPDPPRYLALQQTVQRFLSGLGSVDRMTRLMSRLQVCSA